MFESSNVPSYTIIAPGYTEAGRAEGESVEDKLGVRRGLKGAEEAKGCGGG